MIKILKLELDDWKIFKNIFINIFEIIDEIVIQCNNDGLEFHGIDRSHICFFEGSISKELFDEYELDEGLLLYIDLLELVKVLKRGNVKDNLILEADNELLKIKFKNKNTRTFSLAQLDDLSDSKSPPPLNYSVEFNCDFDVIKNSLVDANLYSDRLTFICEDDVLYLECEGNSSNYSNQCPLDCGVSGSYSATYGVDWLLKIFNSKLNTDNLKIHMGDDFPMLVEMGVENIKMNYLIAPRLGEN